jgi:hypothetical protein
MIVEPGQVRDVRGPESIKELLKQLAEDGQRLLRQEVALAKLEIGETLALLVVDGAHVAVGVVLALLGAMALTAFLIGFIADVLLGRNYWLAALIVGAIFTAIGGFLTRGAIARARARRFRSKAVVEAVREDPRVPPEIKVEAARDRFAVRP